MKIDKAKYIEFLEDVRNEIQVSRIHAAKELNLVLTKLYFRIGQLIVERQEQLEWGSGILTRLAQDLRRLEGSAQGFSLSNLKNMRRFYLEYRKDEQLKQLVSEIPWGHNILLLEKVKSVESRRYYIESAARFGWSRNVLLNQINAKAHERARALKSHNFPAVLPAHLAEQADEALKSSYSLEFLGIAGPIRELELEQLLIERVRDLILELGYGFCFIGNQYRLVLGKNEYFIDLLFYHRFLKALVAVELKTGRFKPEYAGKMDFYLNLLNEKEKAKEDNPSIGIILCAEKDRLEVEFALKSKTNPIGVAEYKLYRTLPKNMRGKLPSIKELTEGIRKKGLT